MKFIGSRLFFGVIAALAVQSSAFAAPRTPGMQPGLRHHVEEGRGAEGFFHTLASLVCDQDADYCALFGRTPEYRQSFFGAQSVVERERAVMCLCNMFSTATFYDKGGIKQAQNILYPIVRSLIAENTTDSLSLLVHLEPVFEDDRVVSKKISTALDNCAGELHDLDPLATHFMTPEQRAVKPPFTIFQDDPKTFGEHGYALYQESVRREKQDYALAQSRHQALEAELSKQVSGMVVDQLSPRGASPRGAVPRSTDLLALQVENARLAEVLRQRRAALAAASDTLKRRATNPAIIPVETKQLKLEKENEAQVGCQAGSAGPLPMQTFGVQAGASLKGKEPMRYS